jgi:predicted TIM-barrel fold metal-dependent hydrolase
MDMLLVDTGFRSGTITGHAATGELAGCPAREVVRIEALLEEVAADAGSAAELVDRFDARLAERAAGAVGLKSIVAYRTSFDIDQTRPPRGEVEEAAGAWLRRIAAEGRIRVEDATLIRHALFRALDVCAERRFPLQLHVGFGDRDVHMPACDPFVREAAWLAEVYSNVHFDVGVILNYTGPGARAVMHEAMSMGPFHKQLYSSDAFGLAELHLLGRVLFDDALGHVLDRWIADRDCTPADAERFMAMIAAGNARRIYRLDEST